MKSKAKAKIQEGERGLMLWIADALDAYAYRDTPLQKHHAAMFAAVLRRLTEPDCNARPLGELKAYSAAMSYAIRLELSGKKQWKRVRFEVAKLYGYKTEQTVSNVASKYRSAVLGSLSRLDQNVEYDGLTRRQMLERELQLHEENPSSVFAKI